jgi:hypothetical protein
MGATVLDDRSHGCPRQDSNLRACLRRAPLYPLSYGGQGAPIVLAARGGPKSPAGVRRFPPASVVGTVLPARQRRSTVAHGRELG